MIQKISDDPCILSLILPVEGNGHCNCYFVISGDEMLIIDPPVYKPKYIAMFDETVAELQRGVQTVSVFFTHSHGELSLKKPRIPTVNGSVFITGEEQAALDSHNMLSYKKTRFRREGFPQETISRLFPKQAEKNGDDLYDAVFVENDTRLAVGDLTFRCILTPGPSRGHCCLLMENEGLLFSGVLLPPKGLPDADIWNDRSSSLDALLGSLEQLRHLTGVTRVYPARGSDYADYAERVDRIIGQYYMRLVEMYQLVHDCPGESAYELSLRFGHRKVKEERVAARNKWFAMKASLSCLIMLRNNHYVATEKQEKCICNYPGSVRFADVLGTDRIREK